VDVHFKIEPRIKNDYRRKSTFKHLKNRADIPGFFKNKIAGTIYSFQVFRSWDFFGQACLD